MDPFSGFKGGADVSFENIVRHFVTIQTKWPAPASQGTNEAAEEPPPAFLEWGEGSDFFEDTPSDPVEDLNADGYGIPVSLDNGATLESLGPFSTLSSGGVGGGSSFPQGTNSGDPGTGYGEVGPGALVKPRGRRPQDHRPGVRSFNEVDRTTQKIMVWNPKDNQQWVIVERILSMRFRGPDGTIIKLNMKPSPPPVKPADT